MRKIFAVLLVLAVCLNAPGTAESFTKTESGDIFLPRVMTEGQSRNFRDAFRILFCGELILLEDQVKRGHFDDMFEYTRKYIETADFALGVFQGPMAGKEAGYSRSNLTDEKKLSVNFPDSFGEAVKRAGFDLVTEAHNHLLDKGKAGVIRTLDTMDRIGLIHTGAYRSPEEKESSSVTLIEKDGIKLAFLSYTYGCNDRTEEDMLFSEDINFLTSVIVPPSSKNFEAVKERVRKDFDRAKNLNPDLIIVLPHMGEQLRSEPDEFQRTWAKIFAEFGADIILGSHPFQVQTIDFSEFGGRKAFTLYAPGCYADIYTKQDVDVNILAEVYIDRNTKKVIGGSVIPMWIFSYMDGNYRPVPLNVIADGILSSRLTMYDFERADEANRIITSRIFGHAFDFGMVREKYYFDERGYIREKARQIEADVSGSRFMRVINSCGSVCFVGDSVTQGTLNGGYPYYEPLESRIKAEIHNVSYGGATVKTLIEHADEITAANSGLYVIAIGANDISFRDANTCAMTPEEYISRLQSLEKIIREKRSDAKFAYIAPWWSDDDYYRTHLTYEDKLALNEAYSQALKNHCRREGHEYFDVNGYISSKVLASLSGYYLDDHIHPNSRRGIYLYSEALTLCE